MICCVQGTAATEDVLYIAPQSIAPNTPVSLSSQRYLDGFHLPGVKILSYHGAGRGAHTRHAGHTSGGAPRRRNLAERRPAASDISKSAAPEDYHRYFYKISLRDVPGGFAQ